MITINLFARRHRFFFLLMDLRKAVHEFERAFVVCLVDVVKAPVESLDQADLEIGQHYFGRYLLFTGRISGLVGFGLKLLDTLLILA